MSAPSIFLLSIAGIFIIGAVGEMVFKRTNIPDVVWLILAGVVLGPMLGLVSPATLNGIAPYFAAVTIVVVLFEGGTALKLKELSQAAPRSGLLALLSFTLAVVAVAAISKLAELVGLLPDGWTFTHGLLLGAILGGSSSVIIMPAMARAELNPKLTNLVNLESALTDALCVVGTSALIDVMKTGATGAQGPLLALGKSFGIGVLVGGVAGLIWLLFLRFMRKSEHAYPITLAALMGLYVLIDSLGGSAALGILTVAILLGNAGSLSTTIGLKDPVELNTEVKGFHSQMAFIIKSFFFVFIGAMLRPPWGLLIFGLLLGAVLLGARIPAVLGATVASEFSKDEKKMAVVSMPRGMAAGVLATLPIAAKIPDTEGVPTMAFACVVATIGVFAVGFPQIKKALANVAAAEGPPNASAILGSHSDGQAALDGQGAEGSAPALAEPGAQPALAAPTGQEQEAQPAEAGLEQQPVPGPESFDQLDLPVAAPAAAPRQDGLDLPTEQMDGPPEDM